jgi:hypothetical protein
MLAHEQGMPDLGLTSPEEAQMDVHEWIRDGEHRCFKDTLKSPIASFHVSQNLGKDWAVESEGILDAQGRCGGARHLSRRRDGARFQTPIFNTQPSFNAAG